MPRFSKFLPGIAWFVVVLVLICIPGKDLPEGEDWMGKLQVDKWVHAFLFGVLAFLFMRPFLNAPVDAAIKKNAFIKIAVATSIWGLATEFIQDFFVTARDYDLWDWGADTAGVFIAFVIAVRMLTKRGGR